MVTELAQGKTLDEAEKISRQDVADELDGLPPRKYIVQTWLLMPLHKAIEDYRLKKEGKSEQNSPKK